MLCRLMMASLVLSALAAPHAASAQRFSWHAAGEAGPEIDSNSLRVNQYDENGTSLQATLAPLFRISSSGGFRARLFSRQVLLFDYGAGGKIFLREAARPADEFVQYGHAGWGTPIGSAALLLSGSYYDASQRVSTRDFRSGTAGLQLSTDRLPARLRAAFDLGYRGLGYKPLPDYSFHGVVGGLGLSWRASSGVEHVPVDWEIRAGYTATLRFFDGLVIAIPERCPTSFPCTEDVARRDLNHLVRVEATYLGSASAGLAYTLESNRSNSYGESFVRHILALRFTTAVKWGVFLTAKGTLQLSRFQDPFLISQVSNVSFASIDEENRSSLIVQFSKELGEHWAINLRWSMYVNGSPLAHGGDSSAAVSSGLDGSFLRQTLFLGVRFEYGG